jgi:hypothetical protein
MTHHRPLTTDHFLSCRPDLVQPQPATVPVRVIRLQHLETRRLTELLQRFRREVMDVPEASAAFAPVEQVVLRVNLVFAQVDCLPGEDSGRPARARQEVPHRDHHTSSGGQPRPHLRCDLPTQLFPRKMVQHSQGEDPFHRLEANIGER